MRHIASACLLVTACVQVPTAAPAVPPQAVVVLGNRPPLNEAGEVAPETAARVAEGVRLFRAGRGHRLMLVGGPAPHGGTESEVMAERAARLGVPRAAMLLESRSRDTIENARNAVGLLCQGKPRPCRPKVTLVTSDYHVARAARLFRCAGARVDPVGVALPFSWGHRMALRMRESTVRMGYWFQNECQRAAASPPALHAGPQKVAASSAR